MKYILLLSTLMVLSEAQRPSYASSGPIGRPGLASRFKDDNASTTSTTTTTVSFENRVGEDASTPKLPVDARGDVDLVNTLNTWDRDHQPFWFINADHIEKARNTSRDGSTQQTTQNQSSETTQIANRNQAVPQGNGDGISGSQGSLSNRGVLIANQDGPEFNSGRGRYPWNGPNNREWSYGKPSQVGAQPTRDPLDLTYGGSSFNGHRQYEATHQRPTDVNRHRSNFEFF